MSSFFIRLLALKVEKKPDIIELLYSSGADDGNRTRIATLAR